MEMITLRKHFDLDLDGILEPSENELFILSASYSDSSNKAVIEALNEQVKTDTTYDDITFGQLIVIEQALMSNLSPAERILKALAAFYRPVGENIYNNEDNALERSNEALFDGITAGSALLLFDKMQELREEFFFKRFNGVIYTKKSNNPGSSEDVQPDNSFEIQFYKVFGWYERQKIIAREFRIEMKKALDVSAKEAMVELSYQKYKIKLEELRNKKTK